MKLSFEIGERMEGNIKDLVVKSNTILEARYKLNPIDQKIILKLISLVQKGDSEFKKYHFKVLDMIHYLGIEKNKNAYADLKEITRKLRAKELIIKEENKLIQMGWLSSATYWETEGVIELEISKHLKPYLLELKERFKAYPLKNVIQFKKSYSFRFYDLLKQYETPGKRTLKITELRKTFLVENKEYPRFWNFEQRILKPSIKEINEKSDLKVTYEKIKHGRNIESIHFTIRQNTEADQFEAQLTEEQRNLLARGLKKKIKKVVLLGYLKEFSVKKIVNALRCVEGSKDTKNPTGLFIKAIREDWEPSLKQGNFKFPKEEN